MQSSQIQLLDIDPIDGTACIFISGDAIAGGLGISIEQYLALMPNIFPNSVAAAGGYAIPFLIENGWNPIGYLELAACSLVNSDGTFAGALIVAAETNPTACNDSLHPKLDIWRRRVERGEVRVDGVSVAPSIVPMRFCGTLTEIENMVISGMFKDFTESALYKKGKEYELIVVGPNTSHAALEFLPDILPLAWRYRYNEHRDLDCILPDNAVEKILSYCR